MIIKRTLLPILLLSLILTETLAQGNSFEWAFDTGSGDFDEGEAVGLDASGNLYVTGIFSGNVDFDPGTGTHTILSAGGATGYSDLYLQKLNPNGNFIWAVAMGGTDDDFSFDIAVDGPGNTFITGNFRDTADFDPGPGTFLLRSAGDDDAFVVKLDPSGNFVWAVQLNGKFSQGGTGIDLDNSGNVYVSGYFYDTVDFDPGPAVFNLYSAGKSDCFVLKLDPSGNFVWAVSSGGPDTDFPDGLSLDNSGNVVLAGRFQGTVDFDPGPGTMNLSAVGIYDSFIQKLDGAGNLIWVKQVSGGLNRANALAIDNSGNIHVTGVYNLTADFDPGPNVYNLTSAGVQDAYILKLDASGNFLWANGIGGPGYETGYGIDVDAAGNVYTTGDFDTPADFDGGPGVYTLNNVNGFDIFIHKSDASGNLVWAKSMGSPTVDRGLHLVVDGVGNIITTGAFGGNCDFDPGPGVHLLSGGVISDAFVQKLGACSYTYATINPDVCESFTAPSGDTTWTASGSFTDIILNSAGCDSIITINLTIKDHTSATISPIACKSFDSPSGKYTWTTSGTYYDTIPNNAGCDSAITVNLNVSQIDNTINQSGAMLSANTISGIFQWLDCDDAYAEIPGATNRTFTATTNGNYAVMITEIECVDTSDCVSVTNAGINGNNISGMIRVFPNPADGAVSISSEKGFDNALLRITDEVGRIIKESIISSGNVFTLDLEKEPAGIYYIEIYEDQTSARTKLVKN